MLRWSHHVDIFGTLHFFLCDASQIGRRDRSPLVAAAAADAVVLHPLQRLLRRQQRTLNPTYIHTYIIIIMVLSNLSVSDVSIYFVWLIALLVVRDELEHLWRAISCCRLNRSPQVSHLNGSFARSATVILLLTVPHCGISLLCRFKSCGRLNCFTYIHTFPSGVIHNVNIPSSCASALARRQVLNCSFKHATRHQQ